MSVGKLGLCQICKVKVISLYIKRGKMSVRTYVTYVRNAGHGQLSSE